MSQNQTGICGTKVPHCSVDKGKQGKPDRGQDGDQPNQRNSRHARREDSTGGLGLSKVFDIENSSKPNDDSYSGNGKKAAGGEDDEPGNPDEGADAESGKLSVENGPGTQIDYFA